MEILRGVTFHQKKSAVSLGKFDGIHLGHQLLMNEIIKQEDLSLPLMEDVLVPFLILVKNQRLEAKRSVWKAFYLISIKIFMEKQCVSIY